MSRAVLLLLGIAPQLIAARAIRARQSVQCDFETAASRGDTCASFAGAWGLESSDFAALNPGVSCPDDLVAGQNYCVMGSVTSGPAPTPTTTTAKAPTTTAKSTTTDAPPTTTSAVPAHSPTQQGLAANCNNFHLVTSGDSCSAIESHYDISAADFASWNPSIDNACSNLWLGYYVCVGVPGAAKPTTTPAPTPTGPSPQMPSIVSDCNKFYQVQSGDGCWAIEQSTGISSAQFLAWNPAVDAACDNLWAGYYVCVGKAGSSPANPTTTQPPTGTGPSPQMPSTVSNCKKYYEVQSGDGCWAIEQSQGISSDQFMSWNPAINSACSNLWLGYYVCVGV